MPTLASTIVLAVVQALKTLPLPVTLTDKTCYPVAAPVYVEGQDQLVMQVAPGPVNPDGAGKGSQEGGAIERTMTVEVTIWLRLKLDPHRRSSIAMVTAGNSLMATCAAVYALFQYTYLGGIVTEPLWYVGESGTDFFEEDGGVFRRDISYAWKVGEALPTALSYVPAS